MHKTKIILIGLLTVLTAGVLAWLALMPEARNEARQTRASANGPLSNNPAALRLGIIPERDIFMQRTRFRALADYLSPRVGRQVGLVTVASYEDVLVDLDQQQVDFAFLGSLVGVLAVDQHDARVVLKPELMDGSSTYRGVIFVKADSPIGSVEQLGGRSIAMVRTTLAGHLFPMYELHRHGLMQSIGPIVWTGTHDEVIDQVAGGDADAGAAKDLRLNDYEKAHPEMTPFRRLAVSAPVPESGMVVRGDLPREIVDQLTQALLGMDQTTEGRQTLESFGARRFIPCDIGQYQAVYDMARSIMNQWEHAGIPAAPPGPVPGGSGSSNGG